MKTKYIKNIILLFIIINATNVFSATIYNAPPKKIGPGMFLEENNEQENVVKEENINKIYYIKDTILEEYTMKYDDIQDNKKYANVSIYLPEVFIENEERTNIANYFLQTQAINILKEYANKYVIDFNQNRASMRCTDIIKRDEYVYKFNFICSAIPMCNIIIDFANMLCYSE